MIDDPPRPLPSVTKWGENREMTSFDNCAAVNNPFMDGWMARWLDGACE